MPILKPNIEIVKPDDITTNTNINYSSSSNYTVNLDSLPINSSCATNFFCPAYGYGAVPVNKILYNYENSPVEYVTDFRDNNNYFCGTVATNTWHNVATSSILDYFHDSLGMPSYVARGSYPQFKSLLYQSTASGSFNIYIEDNKLKIGHREFNATDFKDGIVPDRLIVILSGAGGGGGSNGGGFPLGFPVLGADGGSGGSGACVCVVLNTALLKESADNKFSITVGSGGSGGVTFINQDTYSWGWGNGSYGGSSTIKFNNTILVTAYGGGGGSGAPSGSTTQPNGGSAGTVEINTNPGTYYWWLKTSSGGNAYFNGKAGKKGGGGDGNSTSESTILCATNTGYTSAAGNYFKIGNYSGGGHSTNSAGGAASYFGNGGRGGYDAGGGSGEGGAGGIGAGGGGARYYAYVAYWGGPGGNGCVYIYY